MENNLERWKMRTEFPAIVSPCSTMTFSNRSNIRTLHPSQADFGCLPERRGDMRWLGVKIDPWVIVLS